MFLLLVSLDPESKVHSSLDTKCKEGSSIEKLNTNALNSVHSERSEQETLFFLHFPNIRVKTRLHTENKHPRCLGSVLKVCKWCE